MNYYIVDDAIKKGDAYNLSLYYLSSGNVSAFKDVENETVGRLKIVAYMKRVEELNRQLQYIKDDNG